MVDQIKEQVQVAAFVGGFRSLLPACWLAMFSSSELQVLNFELLFVVVLKWIGLFRDTKITVQCCCTNPLSPVPKGSHANS